MISLASSVILLAFLNLAISQQIGREVREEHPKLNWTQCTADGSCREVGGELTLDEKWRWVHKVDGYRDCYYWGYSEWNEETCNSEANCTTTCAVEGADYSPRNGYGISAANNSVSLQLVTKKDFATNVGLRLFLLDSKTRYQTFTLLNNEFAFDVNLSSVGCGVNSALTFVEMEADGGIGRFPTNKAGAEYGVGYCDSKCTRDQLFVGGKANVEGWKTSEVISYSGVGKYGACCPEFSLWNSNAHSYAMSSHLCATPGYQVCQGASDCDVFSGNISKSRCDPVGCSYSPYQMGAENFYGKGKTLDTSRPFTVITRFEEARVYQTFLQDGKRIDPPSAIVDGLLQRGGLSADACSKTANFQKTDWVVGNNIWEAHMEVLRRPMVLAMSIDLDYRADNLWLEGIYPSGGKEGSPGLALGDCPVEGREPQDVLWENARATVTWSNLRFGPIGSTVRV